ncbi:hypothetical protein SAFG77S_08801 [Streptomyces afghaniensis]
MTVTDRIALDPFGADIAGECARLRALGPIVPVELPGGIPAWAPTRYDTLKELILDARVSKDPRLHWRLWPEIGEHPSWGWIMGWVGVVNMLSTYGADHTRLRKLVAPSFTHRRTEALRPRVEAITTELLDGLDAADGAVVDIKEGFAHPLPMRIICELFGVPDGLRQDTARMIAALMDTTDPSPEHAASVQRQIGTVLPALIAHKTAHPGDDMTTELIRVRDEDGDRLSDEELLYTLMLVIGAGFETTVNLIGNAVVALLRRPEQLAAVRSGAIGWDAVVERDAARPPVGRLAAAPVRRHGPHRRRRHDPGRRRHPHDVRRRGARPRALRTGRRRLRRHARRRRPSVVRDRGPPLHRGTPGPPGGADRAAGAVRPVPRPEPGRRRRGPAAGGVLHRLRMAGDSRAAARLRQQEDCHPAGSARERDRSPVPVEPPRFVEPTSPSEAL